jgi:phage tail-like protein
MAQDPLIAGVVSVVEEVAGTVREDVDAIDQHLDVATASAPMVRYLASWLGADLDPGVTVDRQREVLRAIGSLLGWRGTRPGLEGLLEALTGGRVRVTDAGGVFTSRETPPPADLRVVVDLDSLGELSERQIRAVLAQELPIGALVELRAPGANGAAATVRAEG